VGRFRARTVDAHLASADQFLDLRLSKLRIAAAKPAVEPRWRLICIHRHAVYPAHALNLLDARPRAQKAVARRERDDYASPDMIDSLAHFAWVALGAAIGSPARFFVSGLLGRSIGETFPWGTLAVNASGSVAIGFVAALADHAGIAGDSGIW